MAFQFLWERYTTEGSLNDAFDRAGGSLAALRRGSGREPGTVPEMWPFYSKLPESGHLTRQLRAEHVCLVVYGLHQQGKAFSVHKPGVGLGDALRGLRLSDRFSVEAIDSRVARLATATQIDEIAHHLTSLVQLMKAAKAPIGFDYTRLFFDLVALQDELKSGPVRRRWGAAYFRPDNTQTPSKEN